MTTVALVTTWKAECGIATYSEQLANHLVALGYTVHIIAERPIGSRIFTPTVTDNGVTVHRIWSRLTYWWQEIEAHLTKNKYDVIHFQHEFGLFPKNEQFVDLVKSLNAFVTLHTVMGKPERRSLFNGLFPRPGSPSQIIVHSEAARGAMLSWGRTHHVNVIHHGIPQPLAVRAPSKMGRKRFYGLCPGFISKSKGHKDIIAAFAQHIAGGYLTSDDHELHIVGACRDSEYLTELHGQVLSLGLEDRVIITTNFVTNEMLHQLVGNSLYVILGHDEETSPYSASGQLHLALAYPVPIIAKAVPIYEGVPERVWHYRSVGEAANYISAAINSPMHSGAGLSPTWLDSARAHRDLYGK